MGRAYSTNGKSGMNVGFGWGNPEGKANLKDQDIGGWIILKWVLEREDGAVCAALIWLRTGTGGILLWTW
jgi:hypothetical protein